MNGQGRPITFHLIDPFATPKSEGNYEALRGGTGRGVFYRPERYRVELLKEVRQLTPRIVSDIVEGEMEDFSVSGVSCFCNGALTLEPDTVIPKLWVMIDDKSHYSGRALVTHTSQIVNNTPGGGHCHSTLVGLQLLDAVLDIERILRLKSLGELQTEMKDTAVLLNRNDIRPQYKAAVADLVHLFIRYRSLMDGYERRLANSGALSNDEAEVELLELCWEQFRGPLFQAQEQLDNLTRANYEDKDYRNLHCHYTLPLLAPHLASGAFNRRAWLKPLGYAGDYVLMCHLYDDGWEGDSLYGKLVHRYPMRHQMADAVRNRAVLVRDFIARSLAEMEGRPADEPLRIMGLAAGPAREVVEFVSDYAGNRPVEFTLIDQDNRALAFANSQLSPLLVRRRGQVKVQLLYVALQQLIEDQKLFSYIAPCNLIYSAGLFDYLSTGKARLLLSKLHEKLRPGGRVVIGNYGGPPEFAWLPTYVYDWPLKYRSRPQMLELAAGLEADCAATEVLAEKTETQYFLLLQRRQAKS